MLSWPTRLFSRSRNLVYRLPLLWLLYPLRVGLHRNLVGLAGLLRCRFRHRYRVLFTLLFVVLLSFHVRRVTRLKLRWTVTIWLVRTLTRTATMRLVSRSVCLMRRLVNLNTLTKRVVIRLLTRVTSHACLPLSRR